jgi:hypothetical protein
MSYGFILIFLVAASVAGCERHVSTSAQPSRTPFVSRSSVPLRFFLFAHWEKPRFQDRDAKEYISEYDSFIDQFKDAYWALKTGKGHRLPTPFWQCGSIAGQSDAARIAAEPGRPAKTKKVSPKSGGRIVAIRVTE